MKHDTIDKYSADGLDLTQRALLTTWDCLADYREDLVLVGGLAVRHLTKRAAEGLPDAVTIDVDFGISIGTSGGSYGSIRQTLSAHDFQWKGGRFVREFPGITLFLDLLTDDSTTKSTSVTVDDGLSVAVVPGIQRALECHRVIEVSGKTLIGAELTQRVRVAEVGPLLVLKINAFAGRKAPKDAHDVEYLATNYIGGMREVFTAFEAERKAGNRGMPRAIETLETLFFDPNGQGPLSCAAFRMNNQHLNPARAEESLQIRQQCVTVAKLLML